MILGRGLLARELAAIDNDQYIFYANGISNSVLEQIPRHNFELDEIRKLADGNPKSIFVYFSTSQVNSTLNHERAYVKHKLLAERFIREHFENFLVIRTSNLVGNNPWNTNTLFNYLSNAIYTDEPITVNSSVIRNFLDAAHFVQLLEAYLNKYNYHKIIEIVNPVSYEMGEIIHAFEKHFSKKFIIKEVTGTNDFALFDLDTSLSLDLFSQCNIPAKNYIPFLLKKYYGSKTAKQTL